MSIVNFAAPPKDFDPITAPAKTLAQYGVPRRPDPTAETGLRVLWDRAFARKPTFVQAQLSQDKVWHSRPRAAWPVRPRGGLGWSCRPGRIAWPETGTARQHGLCGMEGACNKTTPAEPGTQIVGFRVELDGCGTNQLLQGGTAATVSGNSGSYWAWTEWVPASYNTVCAPESDHGYVSMRNQRTNVAISIGFSDPQGTTPYDGSSVEWIVEAIGTEMPDFGSVTFTNLSAGTQNPAINLSHAFRVKTVSGGKILATGKILAPQNEVEVIWDAAI